MARTRSEAAQVRRFYADRDKKGRSKDIPVVQASSRPGHQTAQQRREIVHG